MKRHLPKEILIYECDKRDDGRPLYAVAENVDEIPEDVHGQKVGVYVLNTQNMFHVHRSLKGWGR